MARPTRTGAVSGSRCVVEPATPADDAAIRALLRNLPMAGMIALTLEREPTVRHAAGIEGVRHATVVARERSSGRLLAMGCRAVRWVWVNGEPARLGYLAQLRRRSELRGDRRLLASGYAVLEESRHPDELPFDLTSIVSDNHQARRLLERGLPGLPSYHPFAELCTLILPVGRERRPPAAVGPASETRLPDIAACLQRNLRRYQFAPLWTLEDLRSPVRCRGLEPRDFFVVTTAGRVTGCAALWDQRRFKQVVVRGYAPALGRWRPFVNIGLALRGRPRLPVAGRALELAYLSHLAVDDDRSEVALELVRAVRHEADRHGLDYLVLSLARANPMLAALRRAFSARELWSTLYLTRHGNEPPGTPTPDGRCPHVEAATL